MWTNGLHKKRCRAPVSFSSVLVQELSESSILRGITCNRFCFLLTAIIESGVTEAESFLREKLDDSVKKQLKKQKTMGAKILLGKLNS